jgi:hypothetical protein
VRGILVVTNKAYGALSGSDRGDSGPVFWTYHLDGVKWCGPEFLYVPSDACGALSGSGIGSLGRCEF